LKRIENKKPSDYPEIKKPDEYLKRLEKIGMV